MKTSTFSAAAAGLLFTLATASPLVSTKISPCIPASICSHKGSSTPTVEAREARVTPSHGPHTATGTPGDKRGLTLISLPNEEPTATALEKRTCDCIKCETLVNSCGIEYESCTSCCPVGSGTPTPIGTVPACPTDPSPTIAPREPVTCDCIKCEILVNSCGIKYESCTSCCPVGSGTPTPIGTVPACPTSKVKRTPTVANEKRECDVAKVCETHVNECGIEYELCYVPACAGGPATPTPTGTIPTCPPSKVKRTPLNKRECDIAYMCEIHYNECGIEYELCYVPACAGGPATPTPTGIVPTCPPSKAKRAIPTFSL